MTIPPSAPGASGAGRPDETLILDWADLHADARRLAKMPPVAGHHAGIIAIARGGLVPAALLAVELGIRRVETIAVASYDDRMRGDLEILRPPPADILAGRGEGWLVVDDLTDTGLTLQAMRDLLPAATYATLYAKPAGRPHVDTFVREVPQTTWIVFPWDR